MVRETSNGEIEIFGWVLSIDQFHKMMRAIYTEFGKTLAEDDSSAS
jgi:hypothetical protein